MNDRLSTPKDSGTNPPNIGSKHVDWVLKSHVELKEKVGCMEVKVDSMINTLDRIDGRIDKIDAKLDREFERVNTELSGLSDFVSRCKGGFIILSIFISIILYFFYRGFF